MTRLVIQWRPLEPPRTPAAVLAEGAAVPLLAEATARRVRDGAFLRAATAEGLLLVVGDGPQLPWADGVTYLGEEDGLLLPTLLAPDVPADLLRQALHQRLAPTAPRRSLVLLPGRVLTFALADRPVDPGWLDRRTAGEVGAPSA